MTCRSNEFGFKSELDLFNYVWNSRPHISQLTKLPLLPKGHSQWHWQFLHVLPKGSFPKYKFNPENILLGLPEEHNKQESFRVFQEKKDDLRREYYSKFYNKTFD